MKQPEHTETLQEFDPDLSHKNPHNKKAAKDHGLKFDRKTQTYRDAEGAHVRDKFGQPI